jgi:pyruvate carboxylase
MLSSSINYHLFSQVTAHAATRFDCVQKLKRALKEFRVRGVSTNKSFLLGVLDHPDFTEVSNRSNSERILADAAIIITAICAWFY